MIILINGAFGVGKTTTAEKIVEKLPDSMLYDPEEVGYMLWKVLKPIGLSGDFQDFAAWRPLVSSVAQELRRNYRKVLVAPMTIWREDYFEEITEGLRRVDSDFHHFCLTAPKEIIRARLRQRAKQEGSELGHWALEQTEKCVAAFQSPLFEERIDASEKSADEISQYIINRIS